ncbi:SsrA-binding protein SmpB [Streptomyces sp. NPDC054796]
MAKMKTVRSKAKAKDEKDTRKLIAQNKRARHDYVILDTYECGIVLTGTEVKSLRQGRASLVDGFAQIDGGEVWLHNVHIPEYAQGTWTNHAARRKRKLLLHRSEIDKLVGKTQETGHTLVPLQLYFYRGRAKVEIALAKGKKEYDKRQTLREKQDRRETDRAISSVKRRQRVAEG